jgi:hypothetical protein
MIDTETHQRMAGDSGANLHLYPPPPTMPYIHSPKVMMDKLPDSLHVDDQMPEQGLMLLPNTVNGFDFQNKRWSKFPDQLHCPRLTCFSISQVVY